MKKLAVLASGNGTNLQAVIDAIENGRIHAGICMVLSDRKDAYALSRARKHGIRTECRQRTQENRDSYFTEILGLLVSVDPDLIVLAGFMKILPDSFIKRFENRIINIHPSLLPCFGGKGYYGNKVHETVIESGARITGCTVHFVSTEVDGGPIIEQRALEVNDDDTPESLAERIHPLEHEALVDAIALIISGKYSIEGKRVARKS